MTPQPRFRVQLDPICFGSNENWFLVTETSRVFHRHRSVGKHVGAPALGNDVENGMVGRGDVAHEKVPCARVCVLQFFGSSARVLLPFAIVLRA